MMQRTAIVTDTTCDLPAELLAELGVIAVPARYAFPLEALSDGELPPRMFYERMANEPEPPRPFGAPEAAFRAGFDAALRKAERVLCLVAPFDVAPTFTTASAAALSLDDPLRVKVVNPGVASAGLGALVMALAGATQEGWELERLLEAVEELEPQCDTLFVPLETRWLARAGRLALIEEKVGNVGDAFPIVRVSGRITGLALEPAHEKAIDRAVAAVGKRIEPGTRMEAVVTHANAPGLAEEAAARMEKHWPVARLVIGELSATVGSQVGPGAAGIGVAPLLQGAG